MIRRALARCTIALVLIAVLAPVAAAQPEPEPDPWGFAEDEEAEPTLAEHFADQWVDVALFAGFSVLAMAGFLRKDDRLHLATLVAAVAYLGLYKSEIISIVNVFSIFTLNLPIFAYNMEWYAFAVFTLGTTILWGRVYCGRVCAFGALTQLIDRVVPARLQWKVPRVLERRAGYVKYGVLVAAIAYYLATRDIGIRRYVEPFSMFSLRETALFWTGIGVLLVASVLVRNLYCRFLCPVGAFLGVIAQATTVFRIKRWSECSTCRICEKACEWGAIRGPEIVRSECVRCDDCERLYANEKKCPHWIILYRKADLMARQSAAPAGPASL
ncbi:MAG: 4Fe-4S binding protein [Acidimicrobiia bacterium]|nr:4Fe-4S binding protein [Acidimicrobiia bacterium]